MKVKGMSWETYFRTISIPASIRESDRRAAVRAELMRQQHLHDFDPHNRRCRLCRISYYEYQDYLLHEAPICPVVNGEAFHFQVTT